MGGIVYDAAILTNVTHEHLEFHGTWERYRDAKRVPVRAADRLAEGARPGGRWPTIAIVILDDATTDLYGGMTDAGAKRRRQLPHQVGGHQARAGGRLHALRPVGPAKPAPSPRSRAGWGGREVAGSAWDLVLNPLGRLAFERCLPYPRAGGGGGTAVAGRLIAVPPAIEPGRADQPFEAVGRLPTRQAGRPLGGLVERLTAQGRLRGARLGGKAIGTAALAGLPIRGVTHDSRRVIPGGLFVAIPGAHVDGHDFAETAVRAGASALLLERPLDLDVAQLVVAATQPALATAATWWYGDPSRDLGVLGITGTDGKTTTAFLAVAALEAAGLAPGLVSTVATRIGEEQEDKVEHATTPDAPELQATLRAMVAAGNRSAVVETTSHGLALERVGGIVYDAAILTNVTHEHLEFHGTWERYRDAKRSLFERLTGPPKSAAGRAWPKVAIVNHDDASAGLFVGTAQEAGARVLTYGTDPAADVRATEVQEDAAGLRFDFTAPSGAGRLELQLAGRFNVHNALAVLALGDAWELDPEAVQEGLRGVDRVPGRMERVDVGQPFEVVVDYAHSPASLGAVLDLLAPRAAARGGGLIAVFGSAGERDREKRPQMGRIAGERCRLVVVTDEDPRGEDRERILDEIAQGAERAGRRRGHDLLLIADRRAAIEAAFEAARPNDVVLLAGKGHERSIIGPDGPLPWDEAAVARDVLSTMGHAAPR